MGFRPVGTDCPRAGVVASVAVAWPVDEIAAQSHQCRILSLQVQRDRRNLESLLNPRIGIATSVIGPSTRRIEQHSGHRNSGKGNSHSYNFESLSSCHFDFPFVFPLWTHL